ncbi:type VI secretion system baseplate subunit TssG [Bradyrhizobium sp. JYMT SZCCT0428]|uniref:type VI secretion system baseplate subunit TssG n=1 Tax=Bradyrhizobium sp. JYMT SZCCT0428 TaxID=2807673 RepID=UPI001BAC8839|nr:type VI secretion system baseplate subunit TssG [Bradyrhizobium sp. JYMT SZCCT0428]MBR1155219.1 type VI secretion system baseplate subunit TssG [Bradyrhizobium sp. JYMT SZCCT0428]
MTFLRNLEEEPWRFDYFAVLRHLERKHKNRPRIGESTARRDEFVHFGQDPFMDFPASNLARVVQEEDKTLRIFVKYLGLLGPQGALPLAITEEAHHYVIARDDAFPRFLDIFNHRFIQLFFRAWADSRPIAQHDRPDLDRFVAYIGSAIGLGSTPYRDLDSVPDAAKLGYAGLLGAKAKSASRLSAAIQGLFKVDAEVEEFVGTRLAIEAAEWSIVGMRYNVLGEDALLGRTVFSVQDKIRIRIFTRSLAQYMRFLPSGDLCEPLADLVFFYNGEELDWDAELAIPSGAAEPIRLGQFGQLGWTTWMSPNWTLKDAFRRDARFHPSDRMKHKRSRKAADGQRRGN